MADMTRDRVNWLARLGSHELVRPFAIRVALIGPTMIRPHSFRTSNHFGPNRMGAGFAFFNPQPRRELATRERPLQFHWVAFFMRESESVFGSRGTFESPSSTTRARKLVSYRFVNKAPPPTSSLSSLPLPPFLFWLFPGFQNSEDSPPLRFEIF